MAAVVRQNNEASGIDIKPAAVASTSSVHHHHHQPAEVRAVAQPTTSYAAAGNGGAATVVHTNPDGTISLIQVDPANPIITLPDGTTAQVQGLTAAAVEAGGSGEHHQAVQVQHAIATGDAIACQIQQAGAAEIQEGTQFVIAGEDGQGKSWGTILNINKCYLYL